MMTKQFDDSFWKPKDERVIDTVLPEPKTQIEDFQRWMNRMETQMRQAPWYSARKKIEVKHG